MSEERNFNDPQYKRWRIKVYCRDKFKCCLCGSRRGLNVHHIKTWSGFPGLRFVVSNGITLCRRCHKYKVNGNEEEYEGLFTKMVGGNDNIIILFWKKIGRPNV